jgi:hypothetical protein
MLQGDRLDMAWTANSEGNLRSLGYARFEAGIYPSWGQDSKEDGRLSGMLRENNGTGVPVKWLYEWARRSRQGKHLDVPAGL